MKTSDKTHGAYASRLRLEGTFGSVLAKVLGAAAGAAVLATAACGGRAEESCPTCSPTVGAGFKTVCDEVPTRPFLAGMKTTPPIDGAVLRVESAFPRDRGESWQSSPVGPSPVADPDDKWTASVTEKVGTLCATASNPAACNEKVASFRLLPPTREGCAAGFAGSAYQTSCYAQYVLYTRGDEIGVAHTDDEKKALMGTFDTLHEALWAAQRAGYSTSCGATGNGKSGALPDSSYRVTEDGTWELDLVEQDCNDTTYGVLVRVDRAGNLTVVSKRDLGVKESCPVAGRRPDGLCLAPRTHGSAVGEHLATMAVLEAASVIAFRRLRRDLAALGAPRELLDRIRDAARDEVRHARETRKLAERHGVIPPRPDIAEPEDAPTALSLALSNAREGCVRETYGALVAHVQAERATDERIRRAMRVIAREETDHAALSIDIAAFLDTLLDETERAHVAEERGRAVLQLLSELATPIDDDLSATCGIPQRDEALRLAIGLAPTMLAA